MSMNQSSDVSVPCPSDVFGDSPVGKFQREIERVERVPPEFAIPFLLGACSVAGARGIEVESFGGKSSRPNLFIVVEGETGIGKTTVGKLVFDPIHQVDQARRNEFFRSEQPHLKAKLRIIESKLRRSENQNEPNERELTDLMMRKAEIEKKLQEPRCIVEDCTQEALECTLSQQNGVLGLVSTDARKVVKNLLGKHRNGQMDEDVYIKAWSGDTYSVDRITRTGIPPVHEPCLSMFLALQPDLFRKLASADLMASGFFPRLLPVTACEMPKADSPGTEAINSEVLGNYNEHIKSAFEFYRKLPRPIRVSPSPKAREYLNVIYGLPDFLNSEIPHFAPLYRRWPEQVCRIAVCIQIAFWGNRAHEQPLHENCVKKGFELMWWFGSMQRALIGSLVEEKRQNLCSRLLDLVQRSGGEISLRDAWKRLGSTSAMVESAAAQAGLELETHPSDGGRPSKLIRMKNATPAL